MWEFVLRLADIAGRGSETAAGKLARLFSEEPFDIVSPAGAEAP
jgi:hypothetical protein